MRATILSLCACCLLLAPAPADEVRLKDGRVLVGTVVVRGEVLEVTTRDGVVRVPQAELIDGGWRKTEELRTRLRDLEAGQPDTPFSHLHLAAAARDWGLTAEMWRHLDVAVTVPRDSEHANLRSRVDDFLAQLEPELMPRRFRAAATKTRVAELIGRVQRNLPGKNAAIQELLVREANADQDLRAQARHCSEPARRLCAVEALLRRGAPGNDRFALRTTIFDNHAEVRTDAAALAGRYGSTADAVQYLAPALLHSSATVRERTGEALANLGNVKAVKLLVMAGPNAGKALAAADSGTRGYIAFLEQQSYIRDFDVEVAQASFIADPKIGVLQSGVVLDVTVAGVVEERRIVNVWRGALKRLAGSDPGAQPRDWAAWYAAIEPQLSQPAAAPPAATTPAPGAGAARR
ncbi:MAG: hypothetical protein IPK26_29505 [Planctomycetes bacterium]|nr:hypothetical protein [Planctomycetota bacterium]